jgi:hypothetical protein
MSKIDLNDLSFLHAPKHERLHALWWEIEREAGIRSCPWMGPDSGIQKLLVDHHARAIASWEKPCHEVLRHDLRKWPAGPQPAPLSIYYRSSDFRDWVETTPGLEFPHLLLMQWTRFSKSQVKAAVSKWAANQWEAHNRGKKARRNPDPMTGLKQLAAYRLKRSRLKLTNDEIAATIKMECGDDRRHDNSWVRRAVREIGQRIAEEKRYFNSLPVECRAF